MKALFAKLPPTPRSDHTNFKPQLVNAVNPFPSLLSNWTSKSPFKLDVQVSFPFKLDVQVSFQTGRPSLLSNWTSFKLDVQVSFQTGRPGLLSLTVANWDCSLWAARTCDCSLCAEIISFTFSFHYFNDPNVLCKANVRHYFSDLNILCNLKANVRHALSLVPGTCSFLLLLFFISFFKFSHLPNVLLFFSFFLF